MSDVGISDNDSTTSLSSSVQEPYLENGRTYQNKTCLLPNDEQEQDRRDLREDLFYQALGCRLHRCPILNPQKVLDIGTGRGKWAIAFAEAYHSASVRALDVDLIQPLWVPPNLEFVFLRDWDLLEEEPENSYDFVRIAHFVGSEEERNTIARNVQRILKPGGYVEWADINTNIGRKNLMRMRMTDFARWQQEIRKAFRAHKIAKNTTSTIRLCLQTAGFQDIDTHTVKVRLHKQSELERKNKEYILSSFTPVALRLLTKSGWSKDEVTVLCAKARRDVKVWARICRSQCISVYAQKPFAQANV